MLYGVEELTLGQSLLVSLSGMAVVMLELILIAGMIWIMAKIVGNFAGKAATSAPAAAAAPAASSADDELVAVIVAAVSEEAEMPLDQMHITNIQEL